MDWSYISFRDNADVLELLEGRLGLMTLLDEACRLPKVRGGGEAGGGGGTGTRGRGCVAAASLKARRMSFGVGVVDTRG